MGLPAKLKNFNVYGNGASWLGLVEELTLPKLTKKMEAFRHGGMLAELDAEMGLEKIEATIKAAGFVLEGLSAFGQVGVEGSAFRFVGAYQEEGRAAVMQAELVMRGSVTEWDPGNAKVGDKTEHPLKMTCPTSSGPSTACRWSRSTSSAASGFRTASTGWPRSAPRSASNPFRHRHPAAPYRQDFVMTAVSSIALAAATLVTISLDVPILRGEDSIATVQVRKPNAGELRGLSLRDLAQSDVDTMCVLLPRITMPPLTEAEVVALDVSDFMEICNQVAGFVPQRGSGMDSPKI